jgi:asparagine synthase (glutamine-hydrolysing)
MCGLVGIWRHDGGEADRSALAPMLSTILHRGPDGRGEWHHGRVALGHLRLSIIDLTDASHQPMLTPDGTGVLIYNGEIYNYRELRRELERDGVQFLSSGDAEVLLQALHNWGLERTVARLDGMFAFAYLDRRDGALWLARDRVGIKPLVVADTGTELIFASEAKALLAHPRMQKHPDRHAMAKWIASSGRGFVKTLFSGIDQIEPGSWWRITAQGIDKRQYFHALTAVDVDRLAASSATKPAHFVSTFRYLLQRSVGLHLASDAPLAVMCSGGVDSSLISAYTKQRLPGVQAYVADGAWRDGEGDQAERVGRHLGVPIHRVVIDQRRFLELWPHVIWHSDGPPTHPSDAALLAVAQTCRAEGFKVLLTGEGSDELFGGYAFHHATYQDWLWARSWRRFLNPGRKKTRSLAYAPFQNRVLAAPDQKRARRWALALDADEELLPRRALTLLSPIEHQADRAFLAHCFCSLYDHLSWILHRHDRIGMAASIEMRVPFLENDLFDFAFHLPRRAKLHRGTGKWLVKQAARDVLPHKVVYARKKGFPVPLALTRGSQRLLVDGALAEVMEWSAATTEDVMTWTTRDAQLRFNLVSLEMWARVFFGGEEPTALSEKLVAFAA